MDIRSLPRPLYIVFLQCVYPSTYSEASGVSVVFFVDLRVLRRLGFSSTGVSIFTPANSGSIKIRPHVQLALRWNLVETTATSITLNINDA